MDHHGPFDIRVPFTRQQGLAAGLTDHQLQGTSFRRLFQGVYAAAGAPMTPAAWVQAARLIAPADAFAAHQSAARLLGAVVPDCASTHLGTASARQSRVRGLHLHRYAARPTLLRVLGQPCTGPVRTFRDLAGTIELVDLVVLGDSLVRRGWVSPGDLAAGVVAAGPGSVPAARAAAYLRAGVDSGPESRLRMLFVLAGLPEPVVAHEVGDRLGRPRRLDLAWPVVKVAAEYDGRHHIEREGQWRQDLARREDLEHDGWRFVVVTGPDLFRTPGATLERTVRALAAAGLVVPRRRHDWRAFFPERGDYLGAVAPH